MNRRPLVWFAVLWIIGSSAAASLNTAGVMLAIGAMAATLLLVVICRQATWKLAAVCLLGCALAAGERMWADARNVTALPELLAAAEAEGPDASYEVEVSGIMVSAVEVDGDRAMFRVTADAVRAQGDEAPRKLRERFIVHVRLAEQSDQAIAAAWQRGDRVRLTGQLTLPVGATNSGGFDYRRYLSSQRIHWLLKATGIGAVEPAPGPPWTAAAMLGRIDTARDWLGARMDKMYPSYRYCWATSSFTHKLPTLL
ncbi:MAG: ComEC/Rec2 family competence protein [Candidatus Pristimantibacillus sp.]